MVHRANDHDKALTDKIAQARERLQRMQSELADDDSRCALQLFSPQPASFISRFISYYVPYFNSSASAFQVNLTHVHLSVHKRQKAWKAHDAAAGKGWARNDCLGRLTTQSDLSSRSGFPYRLHGPLS